jgi:hypothetical protein
MYRKLREITDVSCHQREIVAESGGCDEAIHDRYWGSP